MYAGGMRKKGEKVNYSYRLSADQCRARGWMLQQRGGPVSDTVDCSSRDVLTDLPTHAAFLQQFKAHVSDVQSSHLFIFIYLL